MWVLVWLALLGQNIDYFHVGTYKDKDECVKALKPASVLVTSKNQMVDCIWVKGLQDAPSEKDVLDQ